MKYNKFLIAIVLCAAMQPNMSVCMENPVEESLQEVTVQELPSKTYGQRMTDYMASWVPQPVKDVANKASVQQKTALGGLLLAALMGYYYRDLLMQNASLPGSAIEVPIIAQDLVVSVEESNIEPATKSTLRKILLGAGGLAGGAAGALGVALGAGGGPLAFGNREFPASKAGFMARSVPFAFGNRVLSAGRAGFMASKALPIGMLAGGTTAGFLGAAAVGALGFALDLLQLFRKND